MEYCVDSSIWVSANAVTEAGHQKAHSFLQDVLKGKHNVVSPLSVLVETTCSIERVLRSMNLDNAGALQFKRNIQSCKHIAWKTIDLNFASDASHIGWTYGLRGMDALVATAAIYYGIPLLTCDKEFSRVKDVVTVLSLNGI